MGSNLLHIFNVFLERYMLTKATWMLKNRIITTKVYNYQRWLLSGILSYKRQQNKRVILYLLNLTKNQSSHIVADLNSKREKTAIYRFKMKKTRVCSPKILSTLGKIVSRTRRARLVFQPEYPRRTMSAYVMNIL